MNCRKLQNTSVTTQDPHSRRQAIIYGEWGLQHKLGTLQKKDKSTSTDHLVRTEIIEGRFKCHPGKKDKLAKWASDDGSILKDQ
jgi:hypothetical protein